jgi:transcription initiation factor IIE alpha subunit
MRWKIKAAEESAAIPSSARRVYIAMVMLADWKGRLQANQETIARCACLNQRQVRRVMPILYKTGNVRCTVHGLGRRPSMYTLLPLRSADISTHVSMSALPADLPEEIPF